ncbi:alpha/beta hydrolase [Fredinandcohnia humi]
MSSPLIYQLHKPACIDPDKTYPALFVMHGIGSNEQNMLSLVNGLEVHFYIFSIRGHLSQPPGYAYFTIQGYGKPHKEVFDQGINQLISFIDYATKQHPIDQNQLYLLGFSQGTIVSMTLGLTLGNRIKGIVALSGYIPIFVKEGYEIKPVNDLSIFILHGEYDNVLPYEWGIESKEFIEGLNANVTFKHYPEGHTLSLQNRQDFINWLLSNSK